MTPAGAADVLVAGAPLRNPWAVAVAPDGAMLLADEGAEAIFRITPAGAVTTVASGRELDDPVGIALAPGGMAYVSDRNRDAVLRVELANGALTKVADVRDAAGLAFDRAGKLLVTDGRAVRRVDPGTGAVTTAAEGAPLDRPAGRRRRAGRHDVRGRATARSCADPADRREDRARLGRAARRPERDRHRARRRPRGGRPRRGRGHPRRPRDRRASRSSAGGSVLRADRASASSAARASTPAAAATAIRTARPRSASAPPPAARRHRRPGGPGGPGGTPARRAAPGRGGTTVTSADGSVVTLPPGVTPATSGIKGVDFVAPGLHSASRASSAKRFRAARRGSAFISVSIGTRISYGLTEPARVTDQRPEAPPAQPRLPPQAGALEPPPHRLPQVRRGQGPLLERRAPPGSTPCASAAGSGAGR